MSYLGRSSAGGTNVSQVKVLSTVGPFPENRLIVIGMTSISSNAIVSGTINASGGDILCGIVRQSVTLTEDDRNMGLLQGILPAGQTFTDITMVYSGNPFNGTAIAAWAIKDLGSSNVIDSDHAYVENATVASVDLTTLEGGVIIVIGCNRTLASQSGSVGGDQSFTSNFTAGDAAIGSTGGFSIGSVHGVNENTVTATFTQNGDQGVMAASWR